MSKRKLGLFLSEIKKDFIEDFIEDTIKLRIKGNGKVMFEGKLIKITSKFVRENINKLITK